MEKNLNEWRYRAEVEIPPRKQSGFQEEILMREEILPLNKKNHWTGKAYVIRMRTDEKMEVKKSPFIIGKSADVDYTIQGNPAISRRHAYIAEENGIYFLKDLNSLNHTFVDGKSIQSQEKLEDGKFFYLADEKFQFRID